ncbi:ABC transporter permease [Geomicrobium sp. JCM 19039]|uniref:ABC transporter permease n=1 Tax=Geomicrobium sp. JCM 19039 TaxID=1460636 RepID=UPI00045F1D71|nr:ABC transporter permease [Geomicrobium sp. JCM 19039]GAK12103.1 ABC-type multidrug transport system, permease component [Geomicrobium sp. JCM 19039]
MKTLRLLYMAEVKLSVREMSSVIFGILLPVGLMGLMGMFADTQLELIRAFAAIATIGLVSTGIMSLPLSLSSYREKKVLKRYKVTPISPTHLLAAHVLHCFSLSTLSMVLVFLVAWLGFGLEIVGSLWLFLGGYVFVMIAIHSIGMLVASVSPREKTTGAISSALFFPMFLLSGATIPLTILPEFMQTLAQIFPLTHGITILTDIATINEFNTVSFLILFVLTGICLMISVKTFKWE